MGLALASQGRLDEAMAEYRAALKLKPDYVEAHNNLGYALASRGRFAEAIAHYRKALQTGAHYAMIHRNLADALAHQGQLDEAIAQYQRTLEIQPADVLACYNLGNALAGRSRVDEAVACYRRALALAEHQNNPALADAVRCANCRKVRSSAEFTRAGRAEEIIAVPRRPFTGRPSQCLMRLIAQERFAGHVWWIRRVSRALLPFSLADTAHPLVG